MSGGITIHVEEVIKTYKRIEKDYTGKGRAFALVGVLVILGVITFIIPSERFTFTIVCTLLVYALIGVIYEWLQESERIKRLNFWVNDFVEPYINTLPTQSVGIISFYQTTQKEVTITYQLPNGDRIEQKLTPKEIKESPTGTLPYVEFKFLDTSLPYKYRRGWYNSIIYVPTDYHHLTRKTKL